MTRSVETEIMNLILKARKILERKEVSSVLTDIAEEYYEKSLLRKGNLEYWLKRLDIFEEQSRADKLVFTAYYLELAGTRLISIEKEIEEASKILCYAARIFEYVGKYSDLPMTYRTNILKHAAICYDAGGNPANAVVMSREVVKHLHSDTRPMETIPRFFHYSNLLIFYLLSRKIQRIPSFFKSIMAEKENVQEAIKALGDRDEQINKMVKFLGYLEVCAAVQSFYNFLKEGLGSYYQSSIEYLNNSSQIFLDANDSENFAIVFLLLAILKEIRKRSVWFVLGKRLKIDTRYLQLLVQSDPPILELWPSQVKAVQNGLFEMDLKNVIVSMPTSAGKTLIAEFAIVNSLTNNPSSTCIYTAPSKALALQVEADLRKRLPELGYKVSLVVGSYDHPEIEQLKLKNCKVLVTTPEKLSLLLKKRHPVTTDCGIFVFDEAQTIQSDDRGIHIEMLIIRIQHILPRSRLLLLSAVMSNPEELVDWMGKNRSISISIDWHPTRVLQAILREGSVEYYAGMAGLRLDVQEAKGKNLIDQALILTRVYRSLGPILIFCSSKLRAENITKKLFEKDPYFSISESGRKRLEELSQRIIFKFGHDFPLSKYVKSGLAYHHADLPVEIRSEIEKLVRKGDIHVIASTTTLAEGINTPVSTVIIPYLKFQEFSLRKGWKWAPITKMLYRNIAGRAGRALQNTEGHVVLLTPPNGKLSAVREYITSSRKDLEPVRSAFHSLMEEERETQKIDFEEKKVGAYQSEILSTICDEIYRGDNPENLIDLTFFGHVIPRNSYAYRRLVSHTEKQLRRMFGMKVLVRGNSFHPTSFGYVCNQTGLTPDSCELLLSEIENLVDKKENFFKIPVGGKYGKYYRNRLLRILDLAFLPSEVRSSETYNPKLPHSRILMDWIFGKSNFEIAKQYFYKRSFEKTMLKTQAFIHVQLMYYTPWVLWAVTQLLDFRDVEYSRGIRLLPAFAKYGVDDLVAVFCSALGVSNRKVAISLAEVYRRIDKAVNFDSVMKWLFSLTQDDLLKIVEDKALCHWTLRDIEERRKYIERIL